MTLADQIEALERDLAITSRALREATTMREYWTQRAEKAEATLRDIVNCHECSGSQCREIASHALPPPQNGEGSKNG